MNDTQRSLRVGSAAAKALAALVGIGGVVLILLALLANEGGQTPEETAKPSVFELVTSTTIASVPQSDRDDAAGVGGARSVSRVIEGLDNVENSVFALGSVWAVTSNLQDKFSRGSIEASVIRIDPSTGRVEHVLNSPGLEPTFAELGGQLWVRLADRLVALDSSGAEVQSIPFEPGGADDLIAAGDWLWVVKTEEDRVSVIDPRAATSVGVFSTGDFPVKLISAFGYVWIPGLIDGTVTIVDEGARDEAGVITEFVTSRPKNVMAIPGGALGDEVWVSNIDGEIYGISAEAESFGDIRKVNVDRPINRVIVHNDRVFLLPTWGQSVLVLDLKTEELLAEIHIGSIPVRAVATNDLIWVTGDGGDEVLTVIDPKSLMVRVQFKAGSNSSNTNGPQQPFAVDDEVWVPNRGDDAFFIVEVGDL